MGGATNLGGASPLKIPRILGGLCPSGPPESWGDIGIADIVRFYHEYKTRRPSIDQATLAASEEGSIGSLRGPRLRWPPSGRLSLTTTSWVMHMVQWVRHACVYIQGITSEGIFACPGPFPDDVFDEIFQVLRSTVQPARRSPRNKLCRCLASSTGIFRNCDTEVPHVRSVSHDDADSSDDGLFELLASRLQVEIPQDFN